MELLLTEKLDLDLRGLLKNISKEA